MQFIGIARIGNDPEMRYTQSGKQVMELSLAYNYGRKNQDGEYASQWITATMWGERAEKVLPYCNKGNQVFVVLTDVYIDEFQRKDGTKGSKLKANLDKIQFIERRQREERAPHERFAPAVRTVADLKDDIPFN